jgi:hypothetical protein
MQRRSSGIQGLVFGGLMAALVVVFALIPGLSVLMPIPLVLVYMRHGGRVAAMTAAVAILMTMAFTGVVQGILAIPSGVMPALVFGYGFRNKWKPLTIGLAAIVVSFLGFAMSYVVMRLAVFNGRDPIAMMMEDPFVQQLWNTVVGGLEQAVSQQKAVTPEQVQALENARKLVAEMRGNAVGIAWTLLPASIFLGGALSTWLNWSLFRATLPRFGHQIPEPFPFEQFTLPIWLVWVYGILTFAVPYALRDATIVEASWWAKLLLNVFTPLGAVFALAGVAVAYGYMRRKLNLNKGQATLILIVVFVLFFQFAYQLAIMLAMWDTIFDFRGLGHGIWKRPEGTT